MTLYRQLLSFLSLLFFILFLSTWFIKLQSTRSFLEDQLESHAQDTATSLGLSLSPYMAENDMAMVETMIHAVFDRGYYRTILLTDIENAKLIEQTLEVTITDVPSWFIRAIPLQIPGASALVTAGWQQKGNLYVESHPGYAYKTLWQAISNMTKVFGLTGIGAIALGAIGLRILLIPLQRIERQAEELCNKQYTFQTRLPKTRELRQVVIAMNSMTGKVKQMFEEQTQLADKLRKNAYCDGLTGLGNRRYLQGQITARMDKTDHSLRGAFLLAQVHDILELNQEKGYQHGDQLLQAVAQDIRQSTKYLKNAALSRISGGTFAIFLPDATEEDVRFTAEAIAKGFAKLANEDRGYKKNIGHVGGVSYEQPTSLSQLLSEADRILSTAQTQGPNSWRVEPFSSTSSSKKPIGEHKWRKILDQLLNSQEIILFGQSVVSCRHLQQRMHIEILARFSLASGQTLDAGIFIPMAERLRRISAIDRLVLEKAMQFSTEKLDTTELAINISPSSLHDASFLTWIVSTLKTMSPQSPRIIFEFTEFSASQEIESIQNFAREIKGLGHYIALDHFGQSFTHFGYLKSLQPKYVKIDKAFTNELKEQESDSRFFISSLASVAHSLDILVIAEGVESEVQYQALCELNIDGVQGYYIENPRQLAEKS